MEKLQKTGGGLHSTLLKWDRDYREGHTNASSTPAAEHTLLMLQDTASLSLCTGR
jgi:hypothetical protein